MGRIWINSLAISGDGIVNTNDVYTEMQRRHLTVSLRDFSTAWCARSHNFAVTHQTKPLPADVLIHLRKRLLEEGQPDLAAKLLLVLIGEYQHPQRRSRHRAITVADIAAAYRS